MGTIMKIKAILISFVVFFSVLILTISCSQKNTKWKGTIEKIDGVTIIKNPKEPIYGEPVFDLEEDLSIGNEDDENYLFYKIGDIEVDSEGNIFVLDCGNHRIQKYDKKGNFLRTIGKKGQGPGEFNAPLKLQLDNETGNIFVNDRLRTLVIFEEEGNYIDKDIHLGENLHDFYLDSDKGIWGKFSTASHHFIKKVNFKGKVEKFFAEIPFIIARIPLTQTTDRRTAYRMGYFFNHGYEYDLFISKVDDHTFLYGHSKEYELIVVDKTGDVLFKIRKSESPQEITTSEKERSADRIRMEVSRPGITVPELTLKFPKHKPFFFSLVTDGQGRIYVTRNLIELGVSRNNEYDVFSKDGLYLYRAYMNYYPYVIKDGCIYTCLSDEETGEEFVKRFRIKNWDKIKSGIT